MVLFTLDQHEQLLGRRVAGVVLSLLLATAFSLGSRWSSTAHSAPPAQAPSVSCTNVLPSAADLGRRTVGAWSGWQPSPPSGISDLIGTNSPCTATYASLDGTNMNLMVAVKPGASVDSAKADFAKIRQAIQGEKASYLTNSFGDETVKGYDAWERSHYTIFRRGAHLAAVEFYVDNPNPLPGHQAQSDKIASALDANLKNLNTSAAAATASRSPTATRAPTTVAVASPLSVGHGCSYNEPGVSQGQLVCVSFATNAAPGAEITFKWTLDGAVQPETGTKFTRADKDLTAGELTLVIAATEAKSSPLRQASSSFKFTKAGADPYVSVQCALRSGDDRAVACHADPKNMPQGAVLAYEWQWNGAAASETGANLNKTALPDGLYAVQVRAKDSKSGKTTPVAATSIRVGPPPAPVQLKPEDIWSGINTLLTGNPSPKPPDPAAVAAAAGAVATALGLSALLNGLLSLLGTGAPAPNGATTQSSVPDGFGGVRPAGVKPDTLPDDRITPPVKPKPRPIDLPGATIQPAKPSSIPEAKPPSTIQPLTPEEIATRRQRAEQARDEGVAENRSARWWGYASAAGYYATNTIKYSADVSVDLLSNLTGAVGKTVKVIYTVVKDVGVGMSEARIRGESYGSGAVRGVVTAGVDLAFSAVSSRVTIKLPPNPLDPFTKFPMLRDVGMQVTPVNQVLNTLRDQGALNSGERIIRDRVLDAGFKTLQSEGLRVGVKDPIKIGLGLKGGKPWAQWW